MHEFLCAQQVFGNASSIANGEDRVFSCTQPVAAVPRIVWAVAIEIYSP